MNNELKNAVLEQLGIDPEAMEEYDRGVLCSITEHGIDGGFHGFVYNSETCAFYDANMRQILELLRELSDEMGETMAQCVSSFNCVDDTPADVEEFFVFQHENRDCDTNLKNALAWFAAEEVARYMVGEFDADDE